MVAPDPAAVEGPIAWCPVPRKRARDTPSGAALSGCRCCSAADSTASDPARTWRCRRAAPCGRSTRSAAGCRPSGAIAGCSRSSQSSAIARSAPGVGAGQPDRERRRPGGDVSAITWRGPGTIERRREREGGSRAEVRREVEDLALGDEPGAPAGARELEDSESRACGRPKTLLKPRCCPRWACRGRMENAVILPLRLERYGFLLLAVLHLVAGDACARTWQFVGQSACGSPGRPRCRYHAFAPERRRRERAKTGRECRDESPHEKH